MTLLGELYSGGLGVPLDEARSQPGDWLNSVASWFIIR